MTIGSQEKQLYDIGLVHASDFTATQKDFLPESLPSGAFRLGALSIIAFLSVRWRFVIRNETLIPWQLCH